MVDIWVAGMAEVAISKVLEEIGTGKPTKKFVKSEALYGSISEEEFRSTNIDWHTSDHVFSDEALPIEISRGCPFRCTFCDYRKKEFGRWIKNFDVLGRHLVSNWERFKVRHYMITDFLVNEDLKKLRAFTKMVEALPFKFEWSGFGRIDLLYKNPEMIELMKRSGCRSVQWGIESINQVVGKSIGKNTDLKVIESVLEACRTAWGDEVIMGSGFVAGLPGDTEKSVKNLFAWLHSQAWLDGWEVTPLFIGDFDESKSYTIDHSAIQRKPEKFGYITNDPQENSGGFDNWRLGDLTKQKVIHWVEEFQSSDLWKNRLVPTYHGYSRVRNLGFSHSQIRKMNRLNHTWVSEVAKSYRGLAKNYFASLDI